MYMVSGALKNLNFQTFRTYWIFETLFKVPNFQIVKLFILSNFYISKLP